MISFKIYITEISLKDLYSTSLYLKIYENNPEYSYGHNFIFTMDIRVKSLIIYSKKDLSCIQRAYIL